MRLHIDWTACDGRGLCGELLPEVLAADDWGYPLVRGGGGNDAHVPEHLRGYAEIAVAHCPRLALRLLAEAPASRGVNARLPARER